MSVCVCVCGRNEGAFLNTTVVSPWRPRCMLTIVNVCSISSGVIVPRASCGVNDEVNHLHSPGVACSMQSGAGRWKPHTSKVESGRALAILLLSVRALSWEAGRTMSHEPFFVAPPTREMT